MDLWTLLGDMVLLMTASLLIGGLMSRFGQSPLVGYLLAGIQLMHHRLLKTEKWNWYLQDVVSPLLLVLLIVIAGRAAVTDDMQGPAVLASVIAIFLLALTGAAGGSEYIRHRLFRQFSRP
mgnify:CR=1 FL=1